MDERESATDGWDRAGDPVEALDEAEIERFARAIARIAEKEHPAGSEERRRAGNAYGTAFQFLVLRRGPEYGLRLGRAAEQRALALLACESHEAVDQDVAAIHDKVCRETERLEPA